MVRSGMDRVLYVRIADHGWVIKRQGTWKVIVATPRSVDDDIKTSAATGSVLIQPTRK
jgi:hypothetical protein